MGNSNPDGSIAGRNYVCCPIGNWNISNSNLLLQVDLDTYRELRTHIAKGPVPLLHIWPYASRDDGAYSKRYDELCQISHLRQYQYLSNITETLGPSPNELQARGCLSDNPSGAILMEACLCAMSGCVLARTGAPHHRRTGMKVIDVFALTARGASLASHRDGRGAPPARRDDREYREYLSEEPRSRRGCIARRMQPDVHHGLLRVVTGSPLRKEIIAARTSGVK